MLAQIDFEQIGALLGACILALGGWRGIEQLILAWRGKTKDSTARVCESHQKMVDEVMFLVQNQKERDERTEATLSDIKDSINTVHLRVDDLYRTMARRD
jgi:hypothetical protein